MGELVEISLFSYKNNIAEKAMRFMKDLFKIKDEIQNIEVMDNWFYENKFNLNTLYETEKYIDSKIITITKSSLDKQIGVIIEKLSDYYCYNFWFNTRQELLINEYRNIYDKFINYILDELKNDILICALGREAVMDYDVNFDEMIREAYNVDIWIIKNSLYQKYKLNKLKKECVILI